MKTATEMYSKSTLPAILHISLIGREPFWKVAGNHMPLYEDPGTVSTNRKKGIKILKQSSNLNANLEVLALHRYNLIDSV